MGGSHSQTKDLLTNYTDITVLLDRSGSMESIRKDMQSGFNAFVDSHKETPTTKLTLIEFDSSNPQHFVYVARPINEVPPMELLPRGGTPLLDALCDAIDNTGRRLRALPADDRPRGVLFLVITDGEENMSTRFRRKDVFDRVRHQEDKYAWQFMYLGANQDAIAEAGTMGISAINTVTYTAPSTTFTMTNLGTKTATFARGMSMGNSVAASATALAYTPEERKEAAGEDEDLTKIIPPKRKK